jgi:hypothetical protein
MKNLALVVEEEPGPSCSPRWRSSRPTPFTALSRHSPSRTDLAYGNTLPDRITIFQRPIEEDCDDEDDVRAVIGETLIHEVGHYFGMSEEEIEEIEERYWRGETLGTGRRRMQNSEFRIQAGPQTWV